MFTFTRSPLNEALQVCANVLEMNGPAGEMFRRKIEGLGKPVESLTLGEIAAAYDETGAEYNRSYAEVNPEFLERMK